MPRYSSRNESASFIWDALVGAYKLQVSWNPQKTPQLISVVRGFVPSSDRDYDPVTKAWWIKEGYFEGISKTLKALYPNAHIVEKPKETWSSNIGASRLPSEQELILKFMSLLKDANLLTTNTVHFAKTDFDGARAFYRKACLFYHPDRHPELASKMSELNEVWTLLKQVYFKEEVKT